MYKKLGNTNEMTHDEWLRTRKDYIGGSDAGAIIGLNPYSSPARVWLDKMEEEPVKIDSERMRIGRDLEDYVAARFSEATGKKVRKNNFMMVSEENPFMMANVDREVVGENAVLECKTTGSYSAKDWKDGQVPPHYYAQVMHYMATCSYDKGYIACLIGNERFVWYEIERDEDYIGALIRAEKAFYENNMVRGIFPEPDGSDSYFEALRKTYQGGEKYTIELEGLVDELIELKVIKEDIKALEKSKKVFEQKIQREMKNHEEAIIGSDVVSWKRCRSRRFDKKAFERDYPELARKYEIETTYRRFSI